MGLLLVRRDKVGSSVVTMLCFSHLFFFIQSKSSKDMEASLKNSLAVFFLDNFTPLCLSRRVSLASG